MIFACFFFFQISDFLFYFHNTGSPYVATVFFQMISPITVNNKVIPNKVYIVNVRNC